jgi:hypothetical protein
MAMSDSVFFTVVQAKGGSSRCPPFNAKNPGEFSLTSMALSSAASQPLSQQPASFNTASSLEIASIDDGIAASAV